MQETLIQWYYQNKRDFPWRKDHDPYHIWISEIMLQQTTTEAVIPYYQHFLEAFPDIHTLAHASLEEVYKMWEGLGYYRRAKHILETAQIIEEKYYGQFPEDYDDILKLKGIGKYTAGAISSIAFFKHYPAVDGNVLRIISRLYNKHDNIAQAKTQKEIESIVYDLIQDHDPSAFNQALMDLGATICKPRNPKCDACPVASFCKAKELRQQQVLPINIKNINKQDIHYITGIVTYKNKFLLIQNKPGGLLENLYGFKQYEVESPYSYVERFEEEYQISIDIVSFMKDIKHVFTHRTWYMHVYHFQITEELENMYTLEDIEKLPLSTAHAKVLKAYLKFNEEFI